MAKAVLCFSGGLDSTVALYHLRDLKYDVLPISVNYGQRHERELAVAKAIDPTTRYVSIDGMDFGANALTGDIEVPDGHYTDESMKVTVVPNRNVILLSLAAAYALSSGADTVVYAAHSGDHAIYPDCREDFLYAAQNAIRFGTVSNLEVVAPFIRITKAAIVTLGDELGVPFVKTYSCYKGGRLHCGACGTCYERKEAFQLAGVPDPTHYDHDN